MPFPPAGQSCSTCYVWDDRGKPGVSGLCRRAAPILSGFDLWRPTKADDWCIEGLDKSTGIPYTSPLSGGLTVTLGTFTASAGSATTVAQPKVTSISTIQIVPTNTDAVTLLSASNVVITNNAGVSFVVNFGRGVAVGTETFSYQVIG
jgi:hypothetical protein